MNVMIHGVICKKCKKIFSRYKYNPKEDVFVECCNKRQRITSDDVAKIQNFDFRCPICDKKVECFYIKHTCPNCGEINNKEHCWHKPVGKPKPFKSSDIRY